MAREIVKEKIQECLSFYDEFNNRPALVQSSIIRKIERSCYNETIDQCDIMGIEKRFSNIKFIQLYSCNTSRIISNIDPGSAISTYFVDNLDKFDYDKICSYANSELNPDAAQVERDEINLRLKQKIDQKVSRKYKCKRCGGNETIVVEYQSRAVDEGSSYSIKCIKCENVQHK